MADDEVEEKKTNLAPGMLIAVIAEEDTVVGFLLGGIGERKGHETNFLIADHRTETATILESFETFLKRKDVAILLIQQDLADRIRKTVNAYDGVVPTVLEIPSKMKPYRPENDSILQRAFLNFTQD